MAEGKSKGRLLLSASSPALFIPEDRLQAVIIADSFNTRFRPITLEVPRALLPVCNFPLIDYTIEFLVSSGIKEIVVYCCAHGPLISSHLQARWSDSSRPQYHHHNLNPSGNPKTNHQNVNHPSSSSGFLRASTSSLGKNLSYSADRILPSPEKSFSTTSLSSSSSSLPSSSHSSSSSTSSLSSSSSITILGDDDTTIRCIIGQSSSTRSAGDALRDLNDRGEIRGDFVLVNGDVVSNIKLRKFIEQHRRRKKTDTRYIMTSIFKKVRPHHQTRAGEDDTVLAVDPSSSQLLFYENRREKDSLKVERSLFLEHPTIQFRYDLLDCNIDICTPDVLNLYKEHFDFGHHRRDFLKSVLESTDLLHTVYLDVVDEEYAARIRDLYTYGAVSRDIVRRWAYPIVPDANCLSPVSSYCYSRGNIYMEDGVGLARSCVIGPNTVIGSGTNIGQHAKISHSVIGPNCIIGPDVQLQNCFIWEGVVLENSVKVEHALICSGAHIGAGSVIEPGSVISIGVRIPKNSTVTRESKLTLIPDGTQTSPSSHSEANNSSTQEILLWRPKPGLYDSDQSEIDEEEDELLDSAPSNEDKYQTFNSLVFCPYSSESEPESDSTDDEPDSDDPDDPELNNFDRFHQELKGTTISALENNWDVDHTLLQIKSYKFSVDKTWIDCAQVFIPAFLEYFAQHNADKAGAHLLQALKEAIIKWTPVFSVFGLQTEDQVEVIFLFQLFAESEIGKPFAQIFPNILHTLYDIDLIEEEAFFDWEQDQIMSPPEDRILFDKCATFLNWLHNAESESDSDDDGEGDDDDDDDDDD